MQTLISHQVRKLLAVSAALICISACSTFSSNHRALRTECPRCEFDIALYDPPREPDGVWEEETAALQRMFDTFGWTYDRISAEQINLGILGEGSNRRYRALVAPGGYANYRRNAMSAEGNRNLQRFISTGGNFIGFCAGAYWATKRILFAGRATGANGRYVRAEDYKLHQYELGILPGTAKGPFGWAPWDNGARPRLETAAINLANPTMAAIGMPAQTRFLYAGGPVFTEIDAELPNLEIWARASKPQTAPASASSGDGEPTIVRFSYGKGTVLLFAYHPEMLPAEFSDSPQASLRTASLRSVAFEDQVEEATAESWWLGQTIVHAALQIATNRVVTPLRQPLSY